MADKKGTGLMMVWADIPADKEDDFNHWYKKSICRNCCRCPEY